MKLSTALFASTTIVLAIAACAAPTEQDDGAESSSQALCPKGQNCTPPKKNWWGGIDPGQFANVEITETGPQCGLAAGATFTCSGPVKYCDGVIARTVPDGGPCDLTPRPDPNNPGVYDCGPGCGGGGFGFGSFNPCMAGLTYTCNYAGTCRCY